MWSERIQHCWLTQDCLPATKAAYVRNTGEVKWNLSEVEVLTVDFLVREDAIQTQKIRELWAGLGL